jgi:hypothetical protein
MFDEESFIRRHKIITGFIVLFLLLVAFFGWRMWGHNRFYKVDFVKVGTEKPGMLQVGVAMRDITPNLALYDTYNDVDNDNEYKPSTLSFGMKIAEKFGLKMQGKDSYVDVNKNGKFDPVWIAGFGSNRPAKGVHDPIWARAIAFRNNGVTVAMVTLDAIGMFHDKIIDIRKRIDPSLKIDHVIVSSLHNHETPDTMGNWSGNIPTPWAFDQANMERIKNACKEAVEEAVKSLQPAEMYCATYELNPEGFVDDSRKPIVIDTKLNCIRFVKPGSDETIATMVNWGNHPETLGGDNPLITSDFSGYWRDGVEKGVPEPSGVKGLGGMCLYFQGMVGGLMTQLHTTVPHRDGQQKFREECWEKAEALGQNLAIKTVNVLKSPEVWKNENPRVAVAAKTVYAPMAGLFRYAIVLGLLHPGIYLPCKARTEIDVVRIGDVEMLTIPGELYPEIADGGVEALAGQDFNTPPVEVPPLRKEVMEGKMRMILGLANDEVGYILPKSEWDSKPPYVHSGAHDADDSKKSRPYGEDNSGGPDVAPMVHHEGMNLLLRMHEAFRNAK